jgi:hypothetical protein
MHAHILVGMCLCVYVRLNVLYLFFGVRGRGV